MLYDPEEHGLNPPSPVFNFLYIILDVRLPDL